MKRTVNFEKEESGKWFIVLPEWTGDKAELQMVLGADTLLDLLTDNNKNVELTFSDEEIEKAGLLTLVNETPEVGGGLYIYKNTIIEFTLDVWLCDVTKFVFGGTMPEKIYFRHADI